MAELRSVEGTLEQAFIHHREGRLADAEALYRTALAGAPQHAYALHMLGVLHWQRQRYPQAVALLRQAVAIEPGNAAAHANLGLALNATGAFAAALASCDRALALQPAYPEALNNRGNALQALGRGGAALVSYDRAVALRPDYAEAQYNRGRALADLARPDEALASFDRALALQPEHADALHHRGNALRQLGRQREAVASYDCALALREGFAEALNNRGNALLALGRFDDALASYDRALAVTGGFAEAHSNRGNVLRILGRHPEALAACDAALALAPEFAEACNNRGSVLLALGRADDALADFDRALALQPGFAEACSNRGNALADLRRHDEALASYDRALALQPALQIAYSGRGTLLLGLRQYAGALADFERAVAIDPADADALNNRAFALRALGRYDEANRDFARLVDLPHPPDYAEGSRLNCQLHCCDWTDFDARVGRVDDAVRAGARVVIPFYYLATSASPADQLACARIFAADAPTLPAALWTGERYAHERIRVAYLSADFHDHATAYLMAELFELHDRRRFEVTGISFGPESKGAMRERLVRAFEHFIDARQMSDRELAQWIRAHEIDIAVDLKGYTEGARAGILAQRPAPVQVSYLGYPGTLGAAHLDYVIADRFVLPPGDDAYYSEQVVRLPDTYQVNDAQRPIAGAVPTRAELGLPDQGFVFCCFNNSYKILPAVFAVWMRLLDRVPGSVLWLLEGSAAAARNLRREAQRRGIAPERLVFAPRTRLDHHLARQRRADLFLDTLPYNAHTTASDALWAGLPVLTCAGTTFAGRVGASLVEAAGLPELVTHCAHDYEALALELATTPERLAALRAKLGAQLGSCALFDTQRFRRHLELAFETMWQRSARGDPPASFDVAPVAGPAGSSR